MPGTSAVPASNAVVAGYHTGIQWTKNVSGAVVHKVGAVTVDVGDTACKVPDAATYIKKVGARGSIGKKRKTVKC